MAENFYRYLHGLGSLGENVGGLGDGGEGSWGEYYPDDPGDSGVWGAGGASDYPWASDDIPGGTGPITTGLPPPVVVTTLPTVVSSADLKTIFKIGTELFKATGALDPTGRPKFQRVNEFGVPQGGMSNTTLMLLAAGAYLLFT